MEINFTMAWGLLYNFKKSLYIKTTLMSVFLRARFRARVRARIKFNPDRARMRARKRARTKI